MTAAKTVSPDAVMAEAATWRRIMALDSVQTLDIYLDLKSPHAYLAVRPTLAVARDYRVRLNFMPYTLSYLALGVTTRVDDDMQRRPPDPAADRKARMYYAAARQYAALQNLPLRSPVRLLDSSAANKAFLFAKHQGLEVPLIMQIYTHGWGSGWRDYEIESLEQLNASLTAVGADTTEFDTYMAPHGAGDSELATCMREAEAHGLTGVPHYVFDDAALDRKVGLFGREHLALIRGKFAAAGLARNPDVSAEFSHAWSGTL